MDELIEKLKAEKASAAISDERENDLPCSEISVPLLDERAFNDTFEENKLYKSDLDHHWLYCFVSYYESAKAASPPEPVSGKLNDARAEAHKEINGLDAEYASKDTFCARDTPENKAESGARGALKACEQPEGKPHLMSPPFEILQSGVYRWNCENGVLYYISGLERKSGTLEKIRSAGWAVAVHNDYRLNGEAYTFWLFTKNDRAAKGEGRTDEEAMAAVLSQIEGGN